MTILLSRQVCIAIFPLSYFPVKLKTEDQYVDNEGELLCLLKQRRELGGRQLL